MLSDSPQLIIGLPSKGKLAETGLDFLARAGLKVHKPNERQYTASIPALPGVEVIFQRPTDILHHVSQGSIDLGLTGYDIFMEKARQDDPALVIQKLGFGRCALVLAVPEAWIDVSDLADLADLAITYKERGRPLRIATKYTNLTRAWLYEHGITHFMLVEAEGTLEVAPAMGYADLIADLTETGTTLRENHLKLIAGGTVLRAEACLIGSRANLAAQPHKLELTRQALELIEAYMRAGGYMLVKTTLQGRFSEALVSQDDLLAEVQALRAQGAERILTLPPGYIFEAECAAYTRLRSALGLPSVNRHVNKL